LFKQQIGLSFRRYMLWRKLTRAMLVIGRERTFAMAAHAADFADAAHLTRTFYLMFGRPPSVMMRGELFEIVSPFERAAAPPRPVAGLFKKIGAVVQYPAAARPLLSQLSAGRSAGALAKADYPRWPIDGGDGDGESLRHEDGDGVGRRRPGDPGCGVGTGDPVSPRGE
jgi:AraC-like DNA-binding protein